MNFTDTSDENQRLVLQLQLTERSTATIAAETIMICILGLVGIVGNSLVCFAVYRNTRLQTNSNSYVTALAVLDLVQTVLVVILALPVLIMGRWMFGDVVCQLEGGVTVVLATGSIYTMTLIALNRYFIMVRTNFHRTFFTKKKVLASIVVSWLLSSNFALSYTLQGFRYSFHPGKALCIFDISNIPVGYGIPVVITNVTTPFFIISLCYIRIYLEIRKHKVRHFKSSNQQESRISSRDIKVTKTLFLTVCAFAVFWTPFVVIDVLGLRVGPYALPRQLYVFYSFMTGCSSVVNPVIYGVMNPDFRREFRNIFAGARRGKKRRVVVAEAAAGP